MSHEFMGMTEDTVIPDAIAPLSLADRMDQIVYLRTRYQAILDVINGGGGVVAYEAAIPLFREIADQGAALGQGFDSNPTARLTRPKETGWLVEVSVGGRPVWLRSFGSFVFTSDSSDAIRFARRQDAQQYINNGVMHPGILRSMLTATEHTWG